MPKTKISEYSATANSNTDVASVNIDEGCAPSGINNAIRAVMGHLKDFQAGTNGDSFNGPVGTGTAAAVAATTLTTSSTVTHNGGTANGVAYLNGSKVLTTGSALVFDGSNLGLGVTPSAWSRRVFQIAATAGDAAYLANSSGTFVVANNARYNSGDFYINSSYATYYAQQTNGAHVWANASSGTAGNAISFTQAMTLDANGRFLVGTTSAAYASSGRQNIAVSGSSQAAYEFQVGGTGVGYLIGTSANVEFGATGYLNFVTNGAERARIDSSGNLLVGTTTSGASQNGYQVLNYGNGTYTRTFHTSSAASGDSYSVFSYNAGQIGSITQAGTTGVLYNVNSDYRLKTVIGPVIGAGERIDSLEPVEYEWKADGSRARGFLAHKFQEVYAGSVSGEKDSVNANGEPVYQAMQAATSEVIADLVAEIQSLRKRLAAAGI